MARVNVEDHWWSDPRRHRLVTAFGGCSRTADGLMLEVWRVAQHYESRGRSIPEDIFDKKDLEKLIASGLVKLTEEGVYVRGSKDQSEYLKNLRERGQKAGIASGKARLNKINNLTEHDGTCSNLRKPSSSSSSSSSKKEEKNSSEQSADSFGAIACFLPMDSVFRERRVSKNVQEKWSQIFPDPSWVQNKIGQLLAWEASNPKRKKRNFAAFVTNCLSRDWDKRRAADLSPVNTTPVNLENYK